MKRLLPACGLFGLLLTACQIDKRVTATPLGNVGPIPTERTIAQADFLAKYNANAQKLAVLYARTSVEITWMETRADGSAKLRHESGDGKVICQAPAGTAITVEKDLAGLLLWAGSDASRYWLFDRTGDVSTLYVGAQNGPAAKHGLLGLPVRPQDVPALLGLKPLGGPESVDLKWCVSPSGHGYYHFEQSGLRMLVEPDSWMPARVELTDAHGKAQVTAELSGRVEVEGDPGALLRQRAEIFPAGREARLNITVKSTSDPAKVKPGLFDLDGVLIPSHKPKKTVDLDREAQS